MRMPRYSLLLILIVLGFPLKPVKASDLDKIIQSPEIQRMERELRNKSATAGLTPGSNMYDLFTSEDETSRIELWLDIPDGKFTLIKARNHMPDTSRGSTRLYRSKDGVELSMEAWVPHPHQEAAAKFRILPEFANLTKLKVKFIEDIQVQNRKAQLLTLENGTCQVNIDLTKATLVAFKSACEHTKTLLEFIELTSLDRFEQKLNS